MAVAVGDGVVVGVVVAVGVAVGDGVAVAVGSGVAVGAGSAAVQAVIVTSMSSVARIVLFTVWGCFIHPHMVTECAGTCAPFSPITA